MPTQPGLQVSVLVPNFQDAQRAMEAQASLLLAAENLATRRRRRSEFLDATGARHGLA
jgi:hypothetical protein